MRIFQISNTLCFGHKLDSEYKTAHDKWSAAYDKAAGLRDAVAKEQADFDKNNEVIDSKIKSAQEKEKVGLGRIDEKQKHIKKIEAEIAEKNNNIDAILANIKSNSNRIKDSTEKYNSSLESFFEFKNDLLKEHSEILFKTQLDYNNEYSNIVNGIKSQLIKKIINPINTRFNVDSQKIESKISISDNLSEENIDSESLYQKILFWAVKLTDSNYGIIDAKNYCEKSTKEFFENLKTILFASNKLYETERTCSITLLSNLQTVINNFSHYEKDDLSEIIDKSSDKFHNSFVIISKQNEEIKKMFPTDLVLNNFFKKDSRFGVNSFKNVLENKVLIGKNLQQFLK